MNPTVPLVALSVLLAGCNHRSESAHPAAPPLPVATVQVVTVAAQSRPVFEEVVGTIHAKLRASVEAKVSGRIEALPVTPGQAVKKGDLLARLSVGEIQARLDQARATLEQADRDLQRFTSLLQQKTITQQEFDAVEARPRVARATVTEAETLLGYATVVAPFDGVITRKLADVGDLAGPGRALVELDDPGALRVEVDVPEALIERVPLGARLTVVTAPAQRTIEGVVSEVSPVADPSSRTFRAKLDIAAGPGLRLGQFARVSVPVGESTAVRVPASAVVTRGQMEIVFVQAGQKASLRLVKTGKRLGDQFELVSGLTAGEQIVVQGAAGLVDGQPLQIKP